MGQGLFKSTIAVFVCIALSLLGGCSKVDSEVDSEENPTSTGAPAGPPPAGNTAPIISGVAATVAVIGTNWSFTPNAADADGDVLTFTIANNPTWATFDSATGRLSGVPQMGDSATYDNIVISVSDGEMTVSLPAFAINVTQIANGAVTLTWTAPTLNSDGSPLTDLASYRIYYGLSEGSYPSAVNVDNPGITTFVVDNLAPNTYFFVTTSLNSSGIESAFSNVASQTVN